MLGSDLFLDAQFNLLNNKSGIHLFERNELFLKLNISAIREGLHEQDEK